MQEAPVALIRTLGVAVKEMVDEGVAEHEVRMHKRKKAPRNRRPIDVEPFASESLDDATIAAALEMLHKQRLTVAQAADQLDVPCLLLERELADYRPRWNREMYERSLG